jgi:hypothetical protein
MQVSVVRFRPWAPIRKNLSAISIAYERNCPALQKPGNHPPNARHCAAMSSSAASEASVTLQILSETTNAFGQATGLKLAHCGKAASAIKGVRFYVYSGCGRRNQVRRPTFWRQADRNLVRISVVSAGFSSGKKCPPFTASPSTWSAHLRQIPNGPPS